MNPEELHLSPTMEYVSHSDAPALRCGNCGTLIGFDKSSTVREIETAVRIHRCSDQNINSLEEK